MTDVASRVKKGKPMSLIQEQTLARTREYEGYIAEAFIATSPEPHGKVVRVPVLGSVSEGGLK